jgi:adenosylhomocysteine nucleosidase
MYDLAVLTALGWERRAVLAALRDVAPGPAPRTWRGRLGDGASCLVAQSGIGPERAASAVLALPPARLMVSCGCAGGLVAGVRPGGIIIADAVVELDGHARAGERLPARGDGMALWSDAHGLALHVGPVAASPVILADPQAKRAAAGAGALAVDMESGALARAARERGVPLLVIRVVLDGVDDPVPVGADVVDLDTGEVRIGRALAAVLPPWRWPVAVRLARQTRVADQRLRAFLARLFGEGGMAALGFESRTVTPRSSI